MGPKQKSVLFIGPAFFGYELSIKNAIAQNGYNIDYFDERTSNRSIFKAVFRIRKSLLNSFIYKHYKYIIKQIENKKYDYFLLIKGEVVPEWFIVDFKRINPDAKLIYYTYDSFNNNNKNSQYILKHFDKCFSFDFEDVKANPKLKLKHLFYAPEFNTVYAEGQKEHTLSFVGTLHSDRYHTIKNLFKKFNNTYIYYFLPAKWLFFWEKLNRKEYNEIQLSEISFDKLSKQQVAQIFRSSNAVLDIQRYGQTGLTMRTFEVLASKAILITTNAHVKQADFYDPNYIVVMDSNDFPASVAEIKEKIAQKNVFVRSIPGFEKYSVTVWVREFFEL